MTNSRRSAALALTLALVFAAGSPPRAEPSVVTIDSPGVFPESITSTADGALFASSMTKGEVYRAAPGSSHASLWLEQKPNAFASTLGVLADEANGVFYVCSTTAFGAKGPPALKSFDLKTGAPKASYPLPAGGFCNDIVVAADGTAFVSDSDNAQIMVLKPGAGALAPWLADPRLYGVDGEAFPFGADGPLYVNNWRTGKVFRIDRKADGAAGPLVEITVTPALKSPDGMRAAGKGRLVIGDNLAGSVLLLTLDRDTATAHVLKAGLINPSAVTVTGDTIWYAESKLAYLMDPSLKGKDPGPFTLVPLPLPPAP